MGFTPLAGTVMGTRCGDVDPSIVNFLCDKLNVSAQEVTNIMNKKSGLLGVSGISGDSRDIKKGTESEDPKVAYRCSLAQKLQINSFVEIAGSYITLLGGCDAIVFTAGVGENTPYVRKQAVGNLEYLGVKLDDNRNENCPRGQAYEISASDSKVKVIVIPTKSIPEGISACLAFNDEASVEENTEAMNSAIEEITSASVTPVNVWSTTGSP